MRFYKFMLGLIIFCCAGSNLLAQQTVGLFTFDQQKAFPGYNLLFPLQSTSTYLLDNCGHVINEWESGFFAGNSAYLLENGDLLRAARVFDNTTFFGGGSGGRVERYDWEGNLLWYYEYSSTQVLQHHDIELLPNGNILILAWEFKTGAEAIAAGRDSSTILNNQLWPDHIIEVLPIDSDSASIIWEWHMWDHLIQDFDSTKNNFGVVADHPELLDLNFATGVGGADWMHSNAVAYNPVLDQILLSAHSMDEIYIIDHSTTTAEAASHAGGTYGKGGDILYRWGNPQSYRRGDLTDQKLFGQHDAHWIPASAPDSGKIMLFNNGEGRTPDEYSSVEIIAPVQTSPGIYELIADSAYGPETTFWNYTAPIKTDFYASIISGAQQQANGNVLICDGTHGNLFEINNQQDIVWQYINPVIKNGIVAQGDAIPGSGNPGGSDNLIFRCYRYAEDYAGLIGKDLTPGALLELNPFVDTCGINTGIESVIEFNDVLYPNPTRGLIHFNSKINGEALIYHITGSLVQTEFIYQGKNVINLARLDPGIYFLKFGEEVAKRFMLIY